MGTVGEKNHYELLGLRRDAKKAEIKEAYVNLAQLYHPDSNFYTEIIEDDLTFKHIEIFKQMTAAYHTLMNDHKRAEYDKTLVPILTSWEDQEEREEQKRHARRQESGVFSNSVGSQGVFGRSVRTAGSTQEPQMSHEEYQQATRSMSEVIRLKQGFWSKLLGVFGVRRL